MSVAIVAYLHRTLPEKPGGIVAFHLSNHYYELTPAVASTARSVGLGPMGLAYVRARGGSRRPEDTARYKALGWSEPFEGPALTDDFSDTLRLLRFP